MTSVSPDPRGTDDGPFQNRGRLEKRETETDLLRQRDLQHLGEDQIRSHLETIIEEFVSRSRDADRDKLVNQIKESHSGIVAVNEESQEIIATAENHHELTELLLSKDYDSENTLIVRADERA